jgi:hypothetical protein
VIHFGADSVLRRARFSAMFMLLPHAASTVSTVSRFCRQCLSRKIDDLPFTDTEYIQILKLLRNDRVLSILRRARPSADSRRSFSQQAVGVPRRSYGGACLISSIQAHSWIRKCWHGSECIDPALAGLRNRRDF